MNGANNPNQNELAPTADSMDRMIEAHLAGSSDELTPSSGFVLSVMESIQAETREVSPIAFPWRRVVPGMVAVLCGLVALIVFALRSLGSGAASRTLMNPSAHFALTLKPPFTPNEMIVGWVAIGACVSIAAIAASFRLAGGTK